MRTIRRARTTSSSSIRTCLAGRAPCRAKLGVGDAGACAIVDAWNCASRASSQTSATTSAARCSRRPSGSRTRAAGSSSSTSATRRRSASRRRRRSSSTSSATCRTRRATRDSQGLLSARTAIVQHYQSQGIDAVDVDDIWLGNGVSELITMSPAGDARQRRRGAHPGAGLPAVDGVDLAGRRTARCTTCCDEARRLAARPRRPRGQDHRRAPRRSSSSTRTTRPARYTPRRCCSSIAELAREHGLVVLADEIYDKILYDDAVHTPFAAVAPDVFTLTFNGLSKAYRRRRVPVRLADGHRPEAARTQLPRGHHDPGQHAAVRERPGPARDPDRARRPAEHPRPDPARRPAAGAARRRGDGAARRSPASPASSRKGALYVFPRLDPELLPDRGRPAVRAGAAARAARAGRAGHRLQLAAHRTTCASSRCPAPTT